MFNDEKKNHPVYTVSIINASKPRPIVLYISRPPGDGRAAAYTFIILTAASPIVAGIGRILYSQRTPTRLFACRVSIEISSNVHFSSRFTWTIRAQKIHLNYKSIGFLMTRVYSAARPETEVPDVRARTRYYTIL